VLTAYTYTLSEVYSTAIPFGVIAFASAFLINRHGGGPGTGAKRPTEEAAKGPEADVEKGKREDVMPVAMES
jgi:hypothetical protein